MTASNSTRMLITEFSFKCDKGRFAKDGDYYVLGTSQNTMLFDMMWASPFR
jgi:hypothetical protein